MTAPYKLIIIDTVGSPTATFVRDGELDLAAAVAAIGDGATLVERAREAVDDVYLESAGFAACYAGLSVRQRKRGRQRALEVEPIVILPELAIEHVMITRPLARVATAASEAQALLTDALGVELVETLRPELSLVGERVSYELVLGDVRAHLDVVSLSAQSGGRTNRRGEAKLFVELALTPEAGEPGELAALRRKLVKRAGLTPTLRNSHAHARRVLGINAPKLSSPAPAFEAGDRADAVARAVCMAQLDNIEAYSQGTYLGLDAEYLHKMRVATRRLRAALKNFAGCFDARSETFLLDELRWLAAVLGEERDLDVHLIDWASWRDALGPEPAHGFTELRGELVAQREAAKMRVRAAIDSARYRKLVARARAVFGRPVPRRRQPDHPGLVSAAEHAELRIGKRVKQVRRAARAVTRDPGGDAVHELRILCKKLRYTAEFYAPLFDDAYPKRLKRLSRLQDRLGRFQDCMVAGALAARLLDEAHAAAEAAAPQHPAVVDAVPGSLRESLRAEDAAGAHSQYLYVLGAISAWARLSSQGAEQEAEDALDELGGPRYLDKLGDLAARGARKQRKRRKRNEAALSAASRNG